MAPVRVRYAPSPTGDPHVGGMRTALFNWLFARAQGGAFILRIEDTDQKRFVAEAVTAQIEALEWLGLDWDEGPDIGGPFGPYVQSQRLDLYRDASRLLIDRGAAYECFCSQERVDRVRDQMRAEKKPPRYDGRCRTDEGRAQARKDPDASVPVVRFMSPTEGDTTISDRIRGEVTFKNALLDDFVLLKSDGFPVYALAEAVDDHAMAITHVIRGEEWISSAPRHKLLFDALGYDLPVFVHTPSILGPDRAKLSKRHGAQSVLEYRDLGYLPEAVFNFLALLGWSLDDHTEIISRDEFVANFSLDRLIRSPAVFDIEKLNWMNGVYLRAMDEDRLAWVLRQRLERPETEGGFPPGVPRPLDLEYLQRIVPLVRERVRLLSEARDMMAFFFLPDGLDVDKDLLLGKAFAGEDRRAQSALSAALVTAEGLDGWEHEPLEAAFRALAANLGLKAGDLFMLMRVAVTGRSVAPPLFETMELLGRERCLRRLRDALGKL